VELAQNAADAARAAGVTGRIRVTLVGPVDDAELRVANTGAPLDAAGVAALASLRASAKRDRDTVGRFGVGFAAVLALTDAPRVVSAGGGVAFSAARTAAAVAALSGPAAELARRDGQLPILRLAWPVEAEEPPVPAGYDTEVRLPLRPHIAAAPLLDAARGQAGDLLLALPGLVEIAVDAVALRRDDHGAEAVISVHGLGCADEQGAVWGPVAAAGPVVGRGPVDGQRSRWLLARRTGRLDTAAAAELAVEQRGRADWSVCWALPLDTEGHPAPLAGAAVAGEVLHAPTATAERLSLPARLFATVPLDPDRRHVRAGPATEHVLAAAAQAYADLVRALEPRHRLVLLPAAGFPRSATDGVVRELVLDTLRATAWLPGVEGAELAPGQAEWLDIPDAGELAALLGRCRAFRTLLLPVPGLAALGPLGATRLGPAALADRLLGVEMPPSWWHSVYAALAPAVDTVPGLADELRALPVPLVTGVENVDESRAVPVRERSSDAGHELPGRGPGPDPTDQAGQQRWRAGRTVAGPASVLLPASPPSPAVWEVAALGLPGLHVAHPAAVHPLLARLGATPADPVALLDHPAVRAAVDRSVDATGYAADYTVDYTADYTADYTVDYTDAGAAALSAAVLGLAAAAPRPTDLAALALPEADGGVARADELMLPDAALRPLLVDDAPLGVLDPRWARRFPREVLVAAGVVDGFAVLVDDDPAGPDHDLADEERWWDSLEAPPPRLVAVRDLDLVDADAWPAALALLAGERDTRAAVLATSSYTAWWLARHARLHGHRPGHWCLASGTGLTALYDPLPPLHAVIAGGAAAPHGHGAPARPAAGLDEVFLAAIGVRACLRVADAAAAADLLARLADPARHPDPALAAAAHAELAAAVHDGRVDPGDVDPPSRVRALDGSAADVDVAVVLDLPWLAAALPAAETVLGGDPAALAELLDLPLASEVVVATVDGDGRAARWAELPEVVVACQTLGVAVPDGELRHHDTLTVTVTRPTARCLDVPAWRDSRGRWHGADPVRALLGLVGETTARRDP